MPWSCSDVQQVFQHKHLQLSLPTATTYRSITQASRALAQHSNNLVSVLGDSITSDQFLACLSPLEHWNLSQSSGVALVEIQNASSWHSSLTLTITHPWAGPHNLLHSPPYFLFALLVLVPASPSMAAQRCDNLKLHQFGSSLGEGIMYCP